MMRLRQIGSRALLIVAASMLFVPGALSANRHRPAKHKATKHQVRRAPAKKTTVAKRKVTRRATRRRVRYRRVRRPRRPSSNRIEQIQQALARTGFYKGEPTGVWDATTVNDMKHFQQAHGITPTGKIDASTLQKLGLGSDVAGVAPPRPVLPHPSSTGKANKPVGEGR